MHFKLTELLSLSDLEKNRISAPKSDPRNLSGFNELNDLIAHSLKRPELIRTQTPSGTPLKNPQMVKRPFHDEALMEKLLRYRSQIPVSSRIIRDTSS